MAKVEETFTWKALHEQDGLRVSESPWGPDDEIGRLNWITPETNQAILEHLSRTRPWLVVVGRTGVDADNSAELGSLGERLVRRAPCNVLLTNHTTTRLRRASENPVSAAS